MKPKLRRRAVILLLVGHCVACTAMLAGGGRAAGPPIGSDTRSAAQAGQDQVVRDSVLSALARDPATRDAGLTVGAKAGVVTLYGTVGSFAIRDRAVTLARGTAGVVRVDNQVRVDTR